MNESVEDEDDRISDYEAHDKLNKSFNEFEIMNSNPEEETIYIRTRIFLKNLKMSTLIGCGVIFLLVIALFVIPTIYLSNPYSNYLIGNESTSTSKPTRTEDENSTNAHDSETADKSTTIQVLLPITSTIIKNSEETKIVESSRTTEISQQFSIFPTPAKNAEVTSTLLHITQDDLKLQITTTAVKNSGETKTTEGSRETEINQHFSIIPTPTNTEVTSTIPHITQDDLFGLSTLISDKENNEYHGKVAAENDVNNNPSSNLITTKILHESTTVKSSSYEGENHNMRSTGSHSIIFSKEEEECKAVKLLLLNTKVENKRDQDDEQPDKPSPVMTETCKANVTYDKPGEFCYENIKKHVDCVNRETFKNSCSPYLEPINTFQLLNTSNEYMDKIVFTNDSKCKDLKSHEHNIVPNRYNISSCEFSCCCAQTYKCVKKETEIIDAKFHVITVPIDSNKDRIYNVTEFFCNFQIHNITKCWCKK